MCQTYFKQEDKIVSMGTLWLRWVLMSVWHDCKIFF